jgi:hypothetical protein
MERRAGVGSDSSRRSSAQVSKALPARATVTGIQRQAPASRINCPNIGATIGSSSRIVIASDMMRAISTPPWRSRTIEKVTTRWAPAPKPCSRRAATSVARSGASADSTPPTTNTASPHRNTGRRP